MIPSKLYCFIISLLFVFISCNSSDNESKKVTPAPNSIESLKNEIRQYPDSLMIVDELLQSNKTKSAKDAWFIKGLYFNYNNEPKKAIPYLDSCLDKDYTYMYAYREKAIVLYTLAKYNDALDVLKRAVTIQNNYDEGYYWMGKCYEKLNRKEDAIESYQNALLYDKDYTEARDALNKLKAP